jgi:hypothetical protein
MEDLYTETEGVLNNENENDGSESDTPGQIRGGAAERDKVTACNRDETCKWDPATATIPLVIHLGILSSKFCSKIRKAMVEIYMVTACRDVSGILPSHL